MSIIGYVATMIAFNKLMTFKDKIRKLQEKLLDKYNINTTEIDI